MGAGVNEGSFIQLQTQRKQVRGAVDSADEKVTKCHVRGEVAVDEVNRANDN